MKKHLFFYAIFLGITLSHLSTPAYGSANETDTNDKNSVSQQLQKADETKAIRLIKDFYANYVFGTKNDITAIKNHCTGKLLKKLQDDYGYDGEGYAIWNFRSGAQDGPDEASKIISVTALGNDLYRINFIDMGTKDQRTLKIINTGGTLKFDAIE